MSLRVLISGSRAWTNEAIIRKVLASLPKDTLIIEGGARGVDSIAGSVARQLGLGVQEFAANWDAYGKAAGMVRNRQMLLEGKPHLVIGFHENIEGSQGTRDMLAIAREAGVPAFLVSGENDVDEVIAAVAAEIERIRSREEQEETAMPEGLRVIYTDVLGDVLTSAILPRHTAVRVLEISGRIARLSMALDSIQAGLERARSKNSRARLQKHLDSVKTELARYQDQLQALQAEFPTVDVVEAAITTLSTGRRGVSEMYVTVNVEKMEWLGNAAILDIGSELGQALAALQQRREKRLPEPAGIYVTGKVNGSTVTVLLVTDELIIQRVDDQRIAASASSGTITMIGLLLLAGKPVTMRELRNIHLAIRKRFRNYSVTAYNSIGVGAPGLRYRLQEPPMPDVAEVGVPVTVLDRLAAMLGRPDLRGTQLAWLVNNGYASALLSKMPPTHGTRSETIVRIVPIIGIEGGLLIPNETAKRHFSDFDGDAYKLYVRILRVPEKVQRERAVKVTDLFLRGLGDAAALQRAGFSADRVKITALDRQIGLDKIVSGEYGNMLFSGLLALIGAEAKNLVAPVATGALAVVAWLAAVDKTGMAAIKFANHMLPLFEPLFDARKGLSVDINTVRKGMPFAHAVVKLLGASTPNQAAAIIREIGDGADQFFGAKAGIGEEMRAAAAVIERMMELDGRQRIAQLVSNKGQDAKSPVELGLAVEAARIIQAMAGTTYDAIPDGDTPMAVMFNGGEDATLKVGAFAPAPQPVADVPINRVPVGKDSKIVLHPKREELQFLKNSVLDGNELATLFGFRFGRIYQPRYAPTEYRLLNGDKISAQPVDPKEMFPKDFASVFYNPAFRIPDVPNAGDEVRALVLVKPGTTAQALHALSKSMVVVVADVRTLEDRTKEVRFRVLVSTGYFNENKAVRNAYVQVLCTEWLPVTKTAPEGKPGGLSIVVGDGRGNYYCVPAIIEPHVSREDRPYLKMDLTPAAVRVAEVLYDAVMDCLRNNVMPKDDKVDVANPVTERSLLADFDREVPMGGRKLNVARMRAEARLQEFLQRCQALHPTPGEEGKPIRHWGTTRFARHLVDISPALVGGRGALTSGAVSIRVKLPEIVRTKDGLKQDTCPVAVPVPDSLDWVAIGEVIKSVFNPTASVIIAPMKDGASPFVVIDSANRQHVEDVGATFAAATWYRLLREKLPDKEVGVVVDGKAGRGLMMVNVAIIDLQNANLAVLDGKRDSTETMFASGHFRPVVEVPHSISANDGSVDADLRAGTNRFVLKVGVENVFLRKRDGSVVPFAAFNGVTITPDVLAKNDIDHYVSEMRIYNEAEPLRRYVERMVWRYAQSVQKIYFTDSLVKGATLRCDGLEFVARVGGVDVPIDIVSSEDSFRGKKAAPAIVVGALRLLGQVKPDVDVAALEAEMNEEFYRLRAKANKLGLTLDELEHLEHELLAIQAQRVINLAREHGVDIVTAPLYAIIDGKRYALGNAVVARLQAMMVSDGSIDWSNVDGAAHISLLQHLLHNCTVRALKAANQKPFTHGEFRVRGDEPEIVRGNAVLQALRTILPVVQMQESKRRAASRAESAYGDYVEDDGVVYEDYWLGDE